MLPVIINRGRRLFSLLNCNRLVPKPPTPARLPARLDCCKFFSAVWTPLRSPPLPGGNLQPICFSERDMGPEGQGNHRGLPLHNNHLIQNEKYASALRGFACAYARQTQPSREWYPRVAPTQLFAVIKRKMGLEGSNLQPSGWRLYFNSVIRSIYRIYCLPQRQRGDWRGS